MTARSTATEIRNLLDYLLQANLALYINPTIVTDTRVTWGAPNSTSAFTFDRNYPTVDDYRGWIAAGHYSAVLSDGGLLQMTYDWLGGQLIGHRLAYVPPPYDMDTELLLSEPFVDVFDAYDTDASTKVALRSTVRFDYDLVAASIGHPATHLTLVSSSCRIPVTAPLGIGQFIRFVVDHFYPETWRQDPFLSRLSLRRAGGVTITPVEQSRLHVHQQDVFA